jgi:hypothetical protein
MSLELHLQTDGQNILTDMGAEIIHPGKVVHGEFLGHIAGAG